MSKNLKEIDFSKITPCGGCCDDCEYYINKDCKGCITTGGERVFQGRRSVCEICVCCKSQNVLFCGDCDKLPCEWIIDKITEWDKDGIEKLIKLKAKYHELYEGKQ